MAQYTVNVKWGKQVFKDVELNTAETTELFKSQLFALTGVAPDRQKVMIPRSGQLKDDWTAHKFLKNGVTIMMVGASEENNIKPPEEKIVFVEDLPAHVAVDETGNGLQNLGNTCYLNSTLQVLVNVPKLREAIIKFASGSQGAQQQALLYTLGQLMSQINEKQNTDLTLAMFVHKFRQTYAQFAERGDNGGYMQQDAEECLSMILQSLQSIPGDLVGSLFSGEYEVRTKCVENPEEPEEVQTESFHKMSCHIEQNTKELESALGTSLSEHIEKHSASLGRTAVYEKKRLISRLPSNLTVQFVRFLWKQDKNVKAKIIKPVGFPMRLDVFKYCTEDLQSTLVPAREEIRQAEDDLVKKKDEVINKDEPAKEESEEAKMEVEEGVLDNDTGYYELTGVVSHQGRSADGGHYVAWVKQPNGDWYLFDDDKVRPSSEEEVKKLSGHGGADWHIAYLCIYTALNKKAAMPKPLVKKTKNLI